MRKSPPISSHQLEEEILKASDREKERVGQELHDGLCQNLAGIAALNATLVRKLKKGGHQDAGFAAEIGRLLRENIGYARDVARGLNPVGLVQIGLAAALQAFAANVQALFHIECTFRSDRPGPKLESEGEMHLYRIAQQAVDNAVTHGKGSRIDISLMHRGNTGRLCIRDDGVGIPRGKTLTGGLGMHTMEYRARLIGASLRVQRVIPHGVSVTCAFPVPKELRHV
jgi:signal transduction histidine kinase